MATPDPILEAKPAPTGVSANRARPLAAVVLLIVATLVFVAVQLLPGPGVLLLPFTNFAASHPLDGVAIVVIGLLLAFAMLSASVTRGRGGSAALLVFVAWIGVLIADEQLALSGIDLYSAPIGVVLPLALALVLSAAWLVARAPRPRAWFSLLALVSIVPLFLAFDSIRRGIVATAPTQPGFDAIQTTDQIGMLHVLLVVAVPFALVIVAATLLSRGRVVEPAAIG